MKINEGKFSNTAAPFNNIYAAFETLFLNLFDQRPVYHQPGDNSYYVPMPHIEKKLKNVVRSESSAIFLFVGSIGIGKSSVLRHLNSSSWGNTKDIETILLDLNRHKTALDLFEIPQNFMLLGKQDQKNIIQKKVESYVASEIESLIANWLNLNQRGEQLFDFFWENNPELLMPGVFFKPKEADEKIRVMQQMQSNNRMGFLYGSIKFYAVEKKLSRLVIVIDNCDQKDPILIESFIDTLGHFDNCFESIKGSYDVMPRLISIISCRPTTRWLLENGAKKSVLGTHGFYSIEIDSPCSLSSLIMHRFNLFEKVSSYKEIKLTSDNGIIWEVEKHKRFLEKLCESLESYGHGFFLVSLCNRNMADALKAMAEILSNSRVDFDRMIVDIVPDQEQPEIGFARSTLLRTLAYGNPKETPIYPALGTRIPNLLSGKYSAFPRTFIKPRLLKLLLSGHNNGTFWHLSELVSALQEAFGRSNDDIMKLFGELHDEGLIETDRGYVPSPNQSDTKISTTTRASCLWAQFEITDTLLGIYRDDLFLSSRHQWQRTPTYDLHISQRCSEVVGFCEDCVEGEVKEIDEIVNRIGINKYVSMFGEPIVSEDILSGVGKSIYDFYKINNASSKGIEDRFSKISTQLNAEKARLKASSGWIDYSL